MNPKISLIAAISKNNVLGKDNKIPWYLPEDLKRFKQLTTNHPIIMGRKTYQSIGRPLPNRTNIVITRDHNFKAIEGIIVVDAIEKALEKAKQIETQEIFIIGGGEIYNQSINLADKLYLTVIDKEIEGDVYFPDYSNFKKITYQANGHSGEYNYKFLELEKIGL